jgi:hypothetical protein
MMPLHTILASKVGAKLATGAVVFVAAETTTYALTPENYVTMATLMVAAMSALGTFGTVVLGIKNRNKLQDIHISMNGRLQQLLDTKDAKNKISEVAAKAEGVIQGRDDVHAEQAAKSSADTLSKAMDKLSPADKAAVEIPARDAGAGK